MAATLNPALRDFWATRARNYVLYGGRASSKSWDAAGRAIFLAQACRVRFLCTRQFQNRLEESVYTLLIRQIYRFGLQDQFRVIKNKIQHIRTGSDFIFYGIQRNFEEIKSTEGVDIWWAEEAWFLTEAQWRDINPTIRNEGSQVWLIFNPRFTTDFVWRKFVSSPPRDTVTRRINYNENPFLSDTMLRLIKEMAENDPEEYRHVYLGEPLASDQMSIIKREWVTTAVGAHIKLGIDPTLGSRRLGYDVADDGSDANALAEMRGSLLVGLDQWKGREDALFDSTRRVHARARELNADIYYDNIGVGAGVGSNVRELNRSTGARIRAHGFGAGEKVHRPEREYRPGVTNAEYFANAKAQAWKLVADRFRNTYEAIRHGRTYRPDEMLFIDPELSHLEALADELAMPERDYDLAGRFKVQSKKELDFSPNLADSVIIANCPAVTAHIDYGDLL